MLTNSLILGYLSSDELPKQYRIFPVNFLYGFYKLYWNFFEGSEKLSIASHKAFDERSEFISKDDQTTVLQFHKSGEGVYSLRMYTQNGDNADFTTNYGFDGKKYTGKNLFQVNYKEGEHTLTMHVDKNQSIDLPLDPYKIPGKDELTDKFKEIAPTVAANFQQISLPPGMGRFAKEFYKSYETVMEKLFLEIADISR